MKENKLSRDNEKLMEELRDEIHLMNKDEENLDLFNLLQRLEKKLKSLLTPIPEDKLDEFVEKEVKGLKQLYMNGDDLFSRFLNNLQSWRLKKILKEYDELKEKHHGKKL